MLLSSLIHSCGFITSPEPQQSQWCVSLEPDLGDFPSFSRRNHNLVSGWKKDDGGSPEVAGPVPVVLLLEKGDADHPAQERNISAWRSSLH